MLKGVLLYTTCHQCSCCSTRWKTATTTAFSISAMIRKDQIMLFIHIPGIYLLWEQRWRFLVHGLLCSTPLFLQEVVHLWSCACNWCDRLQPLFRSYQWRHQKFFCGGHRGGKMWFWGGKKSKICRTWLILAIFFFWLGSKWGGQSLRRGAFAPHTPLDAATGSYLDDGSLR